MRVGVVERANDTLIESLDAVLMVLANLRQSFDDRPQFEHVIRMLTASETVSPLAISST